VDRYLGIHSPQEDAFRMDRHVECTDCHNPHSVSTTSSSGPPLVSGSIANVSGVSREGRSVSQIRRESELCYKCHGDNQQPSSAIRRLDNLFNTYLEFSLRNASYHPVEGPGKNSKVPSLISPLTTNSLIFCTSCHNTDAAPTRNLNGMGQPHGSSFRPLLERNYVARDRAGESLSNYTLCYKCHNRQSILSDRSGFPHKEHLNNRAPCAVCHDPHGSRDNTHLINFMTKFQNRDVVTSSSSGKLSFEDLGVEHGRCYLTCHGRNHDPEEY
jgi:cytochrome c553